MKYFLLICMLFVFSTCKDDDMEELPGEATHCVSKEVVNTHSSVDGTIEHIEHGIYIIRSQQRAFYACNLPQEFKVAGSSIRFDAREYQIPPHVKLIGTPIIITRIY